MSADGWSCVPSLLIVWPEVTRHWSLRLYGGAVGGPWEGFHPGVLPRTAAVSALVAGSEPQPPLASADLPTLADRLASASSVVTAAFLWVLLCTRLYVSSMRESLLSPSCVSSIIKSSRPSKSDSLGIPSPVARPPRMRTLMRGSEPSLQWENISGVIVLQFARHLPGSFRI